MNIESVLASSTLLIGEILTVDGVLMENARRPYLGRHASDYWDSVCIHLTDNGLFDRLFDLLFPHTIGGGNTMFFYPATAVGLLGTSPEDGKLTLSNLQSVRVEVDGVPFSIRSM